MIAIIIPFYQRTGGLLLRAVNSILQQNDRFDFTILVIDDSSPIVAEVELTPMIGSLGHRLRVIRQPNRGPGSARNRGLDVLGSETSAVAFLDSDDEWEPGHVARIRKALHAGADFFFSDFQREGSPKTRFKETGIDPSSHRSLEAAADLNWFTGDLFDTLLKGSPVGTPTVAYNYHAFRGLRFHPDLRAGEDTLFWMEVSRRTKRIAFSPRCSVRCGTGVNIFSGAKWGTVSGMEKTLNQTAFHMLVEERFSLNEDQIRWNSSFMKCLDVNFVQSAIVSALKCEAGWLPIAKKYLKIRPKSVFRLPSSVIQMTSAKLTRRMP